MSLAKYILLGVQISSGPQNKNGYIKYLNENIFSPVLALYIQVLNINRNDSKQNKLSEDAFELQKNIF